MQGSDSFSVVETNTITCRDEKVRPDSFDLITRICSGIGGKLASRLVNVFSGRRNR